jgi:hypothetical protein
VSKAKNVRVASSSLAPVVATSAELDESEDADDFFLEALDVDENAEHPVIPAQAATNTHIADALTKYRRVQPATKVVRLSFIYASAFIWF